MSAHSIAETRNNLSRLVAKARTGETVVITSHGRPVAKIVGVESPPKRRMTREDVEDLRRFRESLDALEGNAATLVRKMRDDEDWP